MERHKYDNTETYDLWKAWEDESGLPVSNVMASWTEQMGFPLVTVLNVAEGKDACTVELEQRWFLADGSIPKEGETKIWQIPMFVVTGAGEQKLELYGDKNGVIKFSLPKNGWFKLNANQNVPIRVNYPEEYWRKLEEAIRAKKLSVVDRSGIIMDAYALTKAGEMDPVLLLQLIEAYKDETAYPVWDSLASVLSGLDKVLLEEGDLRAQFVKLAKDIVLPQFLKVGWDNNDAKDGHLGKLLRASLIELLTKFCHDDPLVLAVAREKFDAYVSNPKSIEAAQTLPSEYRTAVFRIVLLNATGRTEFAKLLEVVGTLATIVEQKDIFLALGFAKNSDLKREALEWAVSGPEKGHVKLQDFFYVIGSVSMSGLEGLLITWEFLKANYDSLYLPMLSTASPSLLAAVIVYSSQGFTSTEKADEIEAFFGQGDRAKKVDRRVKQIVETTRNNAGFRGKLVGSLGFKNYLLKL